MPFFSVIKIFKVFLAFLFKGLTFSLSLFKGSAILSVYNVGISLSLKFKIAIFTGVFLFSSAKIVI
jgi:hypothetical protein